MNLFLRDTDLIPPRLWWAPFVFGLASLLLGLVILSHTDIAISNLVIIFGVYFIIRGLIGFLAAFSGRSYGPLIISSVLSLVVGIFALIAAGSAFVGLIYFIAIVMIINGIIYYRNGIFIRSVEVLIGILLLFYAYNPSEILLVFVAVMSMLAGLLLLASSFSTRTS